MKIGILFLIITASFNIEIGAQVTNIFKISTKSYLGGHASGTMRIAYANGSNITRPLIVFEGFDEGHITKPEEEYGEKTIDEFINEISVTTSNLVGLLALTGPLPQYDIIYLDWANGTDYIQRNALLAEEVIKYVNDNKVAVNGIKQPNVILGKSMGSIIARIALKKMEDKRVVNNNAPLHNTRLYISSDGGQQGSNVPQGFQHLANHFNDVFIKTGPTVPVSNLISLISSTTSAGTKLKLNERPAARQLSINHVNLSNEIDNTTYSAFQTELRTLGYPQGYGVTNFRRVAMSNGSECAKPQPVGNGGNLLTWKGNAHTTLFANVSGISGAIMSSMGTLANQYFMPLHNLGTLPGRNDFNVDFAVNGKTDDIANQVYKGKITYTKKILWLIPVTVTLTNRSNNATASTLAYDYFPGGYQDLGQKFHFLQVPAHLRIF